MLAVPQWVFGPFRLDPEHACLWRAGKAVALTPKALAVLHYLVTHPNRLVSKDELLDAVWPETAVSDAVVRVAIGALRKTLGDPAPTPRYIATVPRRGYRFLMPVEATTVGASPTELGLSATSRTPAVEPLEALATALPNGLASPPQPREALFPGALPLLQAERRPLTVLCCALVDSTRLAGHLDPEDYREIVRTYHQTCADVMQRFDGYLAQYRGDGVLVYFGYPVAHEDAAQRAVHAGLGLLEALEPLRMRLALPPEDRVAVRLGAHTGIVVVGDVGAGARQEPLALGETPELSARLQALAAPNTLVISAATYQLVAGYFTCEALGEQPLRGRAQSLRVYRVLESNGVQSRLDVAAAHGLTPLVGRAPEVGLLVERWARVKAGMGQIVVLTGEAGIGKSRLVQVLKEYIANEVHTCLECRGVPYYQHTAFSPVIEFIQHWLQWQPGVAPDAARRKLETLLTQAPLALAEAVPLLADLVALPLPAERYPALCLTPEQQRQRTFDVVLALVECLAAQQPVLLIVEDLHWVDPSTLELLTRLLDQVPTLRLYLVLTCRPTGQPSWGFRTHLMPLTLIPLTPSHAEAMVQGMLRGRPLPAGVLAQIVAQTDGIPLFVEEVTKMVVEAGRSTRGPSRDVATGPLPALAIPATLHEALLARLDRLGSAKGVAQLGATLGREFPYALLRAVAPLEETALQRDLAALVAAELLYQRGQPPQALYRFKHALIQEAAYESVLRRVRRQTHQRILQVLETHFPETVATTPALLAHHALRGEVWDQALVYCRQAGEQALARSAYHEAVGSFEQALRALPHLPATREAWAHAIDVRLALRTPLRALGDLQRLLAYLREAEALAETLADPRRRAQVALYLANHASFCGAHAQAIAAAQQAVALTPAHHDSVLHALAHLYLGCAYQMQSEYRRARDCLGQTLGVFDGAQRHEQLGQVFLPAVTCRVRLAWCYAELGRFAEGRALGDEGLRIAQAVAHPVSLMSASWPVGRLYLCQGDLHRALPLLEQAMRICQAEALSFFAPIGLDLGTAYVLGGRLDDGLRLLAQVQASALERGGLQVQARLSCALGEAQGVAGHLEEAHALAERALALARAHQERGTQAYALCLLGEIAARRTPLERVQAEMHYRQALTLAEDLGMRPLQAHCHRGFGMLYATMGQREQAHAALSTAMKMYQAMAMTFWQPETEAVLA
jgi:class 3 adenylate cyclase/tetratricopeptide (TPR) repeat protein